MLYCRGMITMSRFSAAISPCCKHGQLLTIAGLKLHMCWPAPTRDEAR